MVFIKDIGDQLAEVEYLQEEHERDDVAESGNFKFVYHFMLIHFMLIYFNQYL